MRSLCCCAFALSLSSVVVLLILLNRLPSIAKKTVRIARVHLSCPELNRVLQRVRASLCVRFVVVYLLVRFLVVEITSDCSYRTRASQLS